MSQVLDELIFKFLAPKAFSARPIAQRITSLQHKLFDDSVKNDTIIIALSCQSHKILHCFGHLLIEQTQVDIAHGRVQHCGGSHFAA